MRRSHLNFSRGPGAQLSDNHLVPVPPVLVLESAGGWRLLDKGGNSVPLSSCSHTEKVPSHLEPTALHFNICSVCRNSSAVTASTSRREPSAAVQPVFPHDFVHHAHVCLVLPPLQCL